MANLIEQQNKLKSLTDEDLNGEGSNPSGSVPPFLVMTEINRRKGMRDAYTAQQQRRKPSTTVAEDLLSSPLGMPARQAMGADAPQGSGGIGIAAALPPGASEVPAFAEGGLVGADMLERIMNRRTASLSSVDEDRDNLGNKTLIAAGAAMMGNGSANFMKNLGAGFSGGLNAWDEGSKIIDSRESEALDGLMGIHSAEEAQRLAALDEQFRRDQEARLTSQFSTELNKPTSDIQNYDYFAGLETDEERANYLRINGSSSGAGMGGGADRRYAMQAYQRELEDARKEVSALYENELSYATPEDRAVLQAKIDAEAKAKANSRFQSIYPDYATLMPELTADAPGATAAPPPGVIDYTELVPKGS